MEKEKAVAQMWAGWSRGMQSAMKKHASFKWRKKAIPVVRSDVQRAQWWCF